MLIQEISKMVCQEDDVDVGILVGVFWLLKSSRASGGYPKPKGMTICLKNTVTGDDGNIIREQAYWKTIMKKEAEKVNHHYQCQVGI